jgi:hypothetical protein
MDDASSALVAEVTGMSMVNVWDGADGGGDSGTAGSLY